MAADAVDAAVAQAGIHPPASVTDRTPLVGAAGHAALVNRTGALARQHGLPVEQIDRLVFRYGTLIDQVLGIAAADGTADPVLTVPRQDWGGYLPAELLYAVRAEGAMALADVLERRTHIAIEVADGGVAAAPEIAALLAPELGWDAERTRREVDEYRAAVARDRAALHQLRDDVAASVR
jgi:glycerol-3-phosphate dehydrogenase